MEMALNRVELVPSDSIIAERKEIGLTLVVNNSKGISSLIAYEDMCDGAVWELNLMYGIGNDVY